MTSVSSDIVIIGGGSSGYGALHRALLQAAGEFSVLLLERLPDFGGTSTFGGINCWEPGIGGMGVHFQLAEHLLADGAGCVAATHGQLTTRKCWADSLPVQEEYTATLRCFGLPPTAWRRFQFEPEAMRQTMHRLLPPGRKQLWFSTACTGVQCENGRITAVNACRLETGEQVVIHPRLIIDCSDSLVAAKAAGCTTAIGEDAFSAYQEPSAPDHPSPFINGVTQAFRVTPSAHGSTDEIPEEYASFSDEWIERLRRGIAPTCCANHYPNGDINLNMLPTMDGAEYLALGEQRAGFVCRARAWHYWHDLQTRRGFIGYRMKELFPLLGVREGARLVGREVLTETDLRAGLMYQRSQDTCIAYGDHELDTHGASQLRGQSLPPMTRPYGIPYGCLLPKEIDNLPVACRGSSFSHIAASGVRLSRCMLALGEAAGAAAVQALRQDCTPAFIDIAKLRRTLAIPQLEEQLNNIY